MRCFQISDKYFNVFKSFFLFSGVSDNDISDIYTSLLPVCKVERGSVLYSAESFTKALGLVLEGDLAVTIGQSHKSTLMRNMTAGNVFGAAALFCNAESFVSSITAKTRSAVVFITEDQLNELMTKYPVISKNYIAFLSGRIRFLNERLAMLSETGAEARVYDYFSALADDSGNFTVKNMSEVCRILGIGRTSLYRAIDSLKLHNKLSEENGGFCIRRKQK